MARPRREYLCTYPHFIRFVWWIVSSMIDDSIKQISAPTRPYHNRSKIRFKYHGGLSADDYEDARHQVCSVYLSIEMIMKENNFHRVILWFGRRPHCVITRGSFGGYMKLPTYNNHQVNGANSFNWLKNNHRVVGWLGFQDDSYSHTWSIMNYFDRANI